MIKRCTCKNTYQDKKYGKGKRVMNRTKKYPDANKGGWRCTVCEAVHA